MTTNQNRHFDPSARRYNGTFRRVSGLNLCKLIPPMSHKNNLEVFNYEKYPELALTELETCMIARNLLFMKIFKLPKSRWSAVKDRIVNVPINEKDIQDTINALPRTQNQAGIVPVKLKRKHLFSFLSLITFFHLPHTFTIKYYFHIFFLLNI